MKRRRSNSLTPEIRVQFIDEPEYASIPTTPNEDIFHLIQTPVTDFFHLEDSLLKSDHTFQRLLRKCDMNTSKSEPDLTLSTDLDQD